MARQVASSNSGTVSRILQPQPLTQKGQHAARENGSPGQVGSLCSLLPDMVEQQGRLSDGGARKQVTNQTLYIDSRDGQHYKLPACECSPHKLPWTGKQHNAAHIMVSMAAVPPPRECPTILSWYPGCSCMACCRVPISCCCSHRAAASMPKWLYPRTTPESGSTMWCGLEAPVREVNMSCMSRPCHCLCVQCRQACLSPHWLLLPSN